MRILVVLLLISVCLNFSQLASSKRYLGAKTPANERYLSGRLNSSEKIVVLEIEGVIMSPMTERWEQMIDQIEADPDVRGVVLAIDSPGGLVADSHRLYKRLVKLRETKPIYVAMGRIAASGGYYMAMAAGPEGKVYAEEITWTGSIGVIIPRFDLSKLGEQFGVKSDSLITGEMKDSLDPFKPLSDEDRKVWGDIIGEAYDEFVRVIDDGRPKLNTEAIKTLGDGRIYTAKQAVANGLVDEIGDQQQVIDALAKSLNLEDPKVVRYEVSRSFVESLTGMQAEVTPRDPLRQILDASVPRAMYLFGWDSELVR
ncbi:MAG: signal peptide peptidase SppA [Planctomycetaceae bacterium]